MRGFRGAAGALIAVWLAGCGSGAGGAAGGLDQEAPEAPVTPGKATGATPESPVTLRGSVTHPKTGKITEMGMSCAEGGLPEPHRQGKRVVRLEVETPQGSETLECAISLPP